MTKGITNRHILSLVLFLFAALFPFPLRAAAPEAVKIKEGVYAFIGGDGATNSGFVVTGSGVIVIDTQGPKDLALLLKEKIRATAGGQLLYAINTHWHGDHTFGNQHFKEARGIIASEETRKALIENDAPHRERFKRFFGEKSLEGFVLTLPDLTFTDNMTIREGDKTLHLVQTPPAHTYGDIYVYLPDESVVFAGDLLYKGRMPWVSDGDTEGAVAVLDELLSLKAEVYVPGHGPLATTEDVVEYKDFLLDLKGEVKRLKDAGKTVEEVKKEIRLPKYSSYIKYSEWLPLNAEKVYRELVERESP